MKKGAKIQVIHQQEGEKVSKSIFQFIVTHMQGVGADAIVNPGVNCRCRGDGLMECSAVEPGCEPAKSFDDPGQPDGWSARPVEG